MSDHPVESSAETPVVPRLSSLQKLALGVTRYHKWCWAERSDPEGDWVRWADVVAGLEDETPIVPSSWQPIESAPKDHEGPRLLVWDGNVHFATRGFTTELRRAGWFNEHGWLIHPTHWMPLPLPPGAAPVVAPAPQPEEKEDQTSRVDASAVASSAGSTAKTS